MANELQMIRLLIDRVEAQGDSGRKQILGYHGQITDLCNNLLTRIHAGDQAAASEVGELRLLNEQIQTRVGTEKAGPWEKLAGPLQSALMPLYTLALYGPTDAEQAVENAITKLELQKSLAT